ncbi:MAG: MFS transporter, partial [Solirubrobacteraceae bacterium]
DMLGAAGFTIAVAALVLAIVEGQTWGWWSVRTLVLFAVVPVVLVAIWRRSVHHASPIVDPQMLRVRSFALALLGSILFYAGFGAMLLGGVLFLTGVWHESVLSAGLMLAPGPVLAATFSVVSSRLAGRVGFRALGVFGTLLVSAAAVWWILRNGDAPSYPTTYLPGMLLTGIGVGFTIPILTGAGVASLAPERFATGVAVITMGRQVGSALGVAILVAVLATGASTAADFHHAWLIVLCGSLGSAAALAALGSARTRAPTGALATELS